MPEQDLRLYVSMFLIAALFVCVRAWISNRGVGLVFTYVVSLATNFLLAPALLLLPWYNGQGFDLTVRGMRESMFAMVAFAAGTEVVAAFYSRRKQERSDDSDLAASDSSAVEQFVVDRRIVRFYLVAGILLYGVIFPIAGEVASLGALAATGSTLAVVAIGLLCWNAFHERRTGLFWVCVASTALLPVLTVLGQGFIGYGFAAMLTVLSFVTSFYRPRWKIFVLGLALAYVGLSVYVTYMRDRKDIRQVVWGGGSVGSRLSQAQDTTANFEWFDIQNSDHLDRIENRLNQDYLVGAAEAYIDSRAVGFAEGATVWQAFLAVIPRAIWPNKPIVGGSGDLVTEYTGIRFAEGTSVGIGQVMESYVNFGTAGVLAYFFVLGMMLTAIDARAHDWLSRGDASRFLIWYLPGLSFLQVGGSLAEVTSTAAAGLVMAVVLKKVISVAAPDRRGDGRVEPATTGRIL